MTNELIDELTDDLKVPFNRVLQAIEVACHEAGRLPSTVQLLAVSKKVSAERIRQMAILGQRAFGENYIQEAIDKMAVLSDLPIEWHLIGPIQSNKTRLVAESFAWVHSVDRLKIAERLSDQRPANMEDLNICLQVNLSQEQTKSGVSVDEMIPLALKVASLPRLRLRGLMAIPAPTADPVLQRTTYRDMKHLLATLSREGVDCDTLSMGMSADLGAAIAEGATWVRIGTALFGERQP